MLTSLYTVLLAGAVEVRTVLISLALLPWVSSEKSDHGLPRAFTCRHLSKKATILS